MSIRTSAPFNSATLPSALPLSTQIKALSGYKSWGQGDAQFVTLDGTVANAITSFVDLKLGTPILTQPVVSRKALLTANKIKTFSGAVFDGVDDHYPFPAGYLDLTADFTVAVAFTLNALATGSQYILASFNDVSNRTLLQISPAGALLFVHGNAALTLGTLVAGGNYFVVIEKAGGTIRGRLNGVDVGPVATNNLAGTVTLYLGALSGGLSGFFNGTLYDLITSTAGKISDGSFVTLEKHPKLVYGIPAS